MEEKKLMSLFQYIFSNIFPNILNLPRIDFINDLTSSVKAILEDQYSNNIYSNQKFFSSFLHINKNFEKKYNDYNQLLSTAWDNYQNELHNMKKEEDLDKYKLKEFKKHCKDTQEYAMHNCNKNERGHYIIVYDSNKKEKKFIICEKCRKVYYTYLFISYCKNCNCNYYCGLLAQKEDQNMQQATYFTPHCEPIANDKINCTKCKSTFYYNIKDNLLQCINPSCKYHIRPNTANWKCNICSNYFKSDIKIFNNFELLYIKKIVGISLLVKEKAHPGIIPCCKNLDENELFFYHKKDCRGSLFFWILNNKVIVICDKCKAINYFSRFIWTCPNCGLHFKAKKEEIEEKIKKTLFKNLKLKIKMNILLGDEYLLRQDDNNDNSSINNNKMARKKSFREVLNMKKQELFIIERKDSIKKNYGTKEKKRSEQICNDNDENNNNNNNDDNYRYTTTNSKSKLDEEVKTSMKKRKNYLFDKLLRNQFLSKIKTSKEKDKDEIYSNNKNKLDIHFITEEKNNKENEEIKPKEKEKEKEVAETDKKLIRLRDRSQSNYLKNRKENHKLNNNINNEKEEKDKKINGNDENDDNKLNNSDDAEKVNKNSYLMDYNKKMKKKNEISNKKGLPPLPIMRAKSGFIPKNENKDCYENNYDEEIYDIKDYNYKEKISMENKSKFHVKSKFNNDEKNKDDIKMEYKLEQQKGYKSPRIILENDLGENNKDNKENINNNNNDYFLGRRFGHSKSNNKINIISNINVLNDENNKIEKIVQRLEDKFNENYSQKKTKNETNSKEEEEKSEDKDKNNDDIEEECNNNEQVKIKNIKNIKEKYAFSPNENIVNNNNNNNNCNHKKYLFYKNKHFKEKEKEKEKKEEQEEEIPKLNTNEEEEGKKLQKEKDNNYPDDIINASMFDSKMDIPIDNPTIQNDKILYTSIQRQIKKILSKNKLPQFNIDNYQTEKQIGEGSFGFIYQVRNKKTNMKYALKKIIANNLTSLEAYQKEFEIVHQCSHPNILDVLGICIRCFDQTTYVLYVLMDLALWDWDFEIEERKKTKKYYKEDELISILKQISSALVFLQKEKNIAHRDVKPENILVFNNGVYKLGDFGEAKMDKLMKKNQKNTIRGTEMYMSPLLFKSLQEDKDDVQHNIFKSDVFSLGYCFIFAASLDFKVISEIRNINSDFKLRKILQRMFFLKYSNNFIELILKMICNKEEERVDFIGLEKLIEEAKF